MTTKTLDLNDIERKIFWGLVSCLILVVSFYLYSLLSLTIAGVDRDHLSRNAHNLSVKIGDLESEYLTESNSVTLARAEALGFHEVNARFTNSSASVTSKAFEPMKISMAH